MQTVQFSTNLSNLNAINNTHYTVVEGYKIAILLCICMVLDLSQQAGSPWGMAPHFLNNILINYEIFKFHHIIHKSTNFAPQSKTPSQAYAFQNLMKMFKSIYYWLLYMCGYSTVYQNMHEPIRIIMIHEM